ncbi:hypothetical protein SFRURICE_016936 [Spodoptera frugiperda]|nr:hypothetical protein SFRURICE_016936 [Spodoptera frugiperda]
MIERKRRLRRSWQRTRCPTMKSSLNALAAKISSAVANHAGESWQRAIERATDDWSGIHRLCRNLAGKPAPIRPLLAGDGTPRERRKRRRRKKAPPPTAAAPKPAAAPAGAPRAPAAALATAPTGAPRAPAATTTFATSAATAARPARRTAAPRPATQPTPAQPARTLTVNDVVRILQEIVTALVTQRSDPVPLLLDAIKSLVCDGPAAP